MQIQQIEITAKSKKQIKINIESIEKSNAGNLADILESESGIFIKSYGIGSSSTISMRGGNANQALIKWNNIPINNPMLGLSDLSLTPIMLFDDVVIKKGGQSALGGGGALTGEIDLNDSKKIINNSLIIRSGISNLGLLKFSGKANWVLGKLSGSTKAITLEADNNFKYTIASGAEKELSHAYISNKAFIQNLNYSINNNALLKLDFWWQETFREIPPLTTQNESRAFQDDQLTRLVVTHLHLNKKSSFETQLAYINEHNNYNDSLNLVDTQNKFERLLLQGTSGFDLSNQLNLQLKYEYFNDRASTQFYESEVVQNRVGLSALVEKGMGNLTLSAALRREMYAGNFAPWTPLIKLDFDFSTAVEITMKVSKEFRTPTLNELNWRPGGDTELLPEEGWNQELDFRFKHKTHLIEINSFHRLINNWILWGLEDNSFFYSVQNLNRVRSYGLEYGHQIEFKLGTLTGLLKYHYNYTRSKNMVSLSSPRIEAGEQLLYVPLHTGGFSWNIQNNNEGLKIKSNYTGSVEGINEDIDGYLLTDLSLFKTFEFKQKSLKLFLNINNIFNKQYRVIERRPMPGRNLSLDVQLNLN